MSVEQKQVWLLWASVDNSPDSDHPYDDVLTCFDGYPSDEDLVVAFSEYGFSDALIANLLRVGAGYVVNKDEDHHSVSFEIKSMVVQGVLT